MPDNQPYLEVEHTHHGIELHALHNLTREDVHQLMDALRSRRLLMTLRMDETDLPYQVRNKLRADASRLDIINAALKHTLHDQYDAASRSHVDHDHPVAG